MPFTLSHAAAAWPFRRTRLVFSALIFGCFVPDFPYFFFLRAHGFHGHTLRGIVVFDLPVGLAALWLYHRYVKQASLIYLPEGFRRRLTLRPFSFLPPARLGLIALSIMIGSATHILWDVFTHDNYWPYRHWGFLRLEVPLPILDQLVMYKFLQYISSVAGLVFVVVWIWHWYRTTAPLEHLVERPFTVAQKTTMLVVLPLGAISAGIFRGHERIGIPNALRPMVAFTADAAVTAIAIFVLGLLVFGLTLRNRETAIDGV